MPVRGRRGEIIGISVTAEEITERRRVEQLRDTFIGMLSHELRTPMTSLYAASQLLRRREADGGTAGRDHDLVDEVVAGAERLQRIVENLLVLARVERGVAMPGADPVLLQRVLPGVVSGERRLWPDHRIELATLPPDLPPVRSDTDALVQVIRNLVSNAAKYGPSDGRIVIDVARPTPDVVCLRVTDEGPGLAGVDPERLFDLYYRAADASKRAAGAGIGLFVSRALVEGMGGTLSAADAEDGGAVFRVCLPVFSED
jgi:signal transduction histidine kinase